MPNWLAAVLLATPGDGPTVNAGGDQTTPATARTASHETLVAVSAAAPAAATKTPGTRELPAGRGHVNRLKHPGIGTTGALGGTTTGSSWPGGRWRGVDAGGGQLELSACCAGAVRRQTVRRVCALALPACTARAIGAPGRHRVTRGGGSLPTTDRVRGQATQQVRRRDEFWSGTGLIGPAVIIRGSRALGKGRATLLVSALDGIAGTHKRLPQPSTWCTRGEGTRALFSAYPRDLQDAGGTQGRPFLMGSPLRNPLVRSRSAHREPGPERRR